LLSQYLYGFSVTPGGAAVGAVYGFIIGYLTGYLFARARNFGMAIYLRIIWRRAEHHLASDLLDRI
jgi:membrane protease YdiL (CAAX protease family)